MSFYIYIYIYIYISLSLLLLLLKFPGLFPTVSTKCGECGDYGVCSESCGVGTMDGTVDCWLVSGVDGHEMPSTRHKRPCNKTCFIPCPKKKCGDCGDYGPCSESCGAEGQMGATQDCWLNDGVTGLEVPGSRYHTACTDTCYIPCPTPCKV